MTTATSWLTTMHNTHNPHLTSHTLPSLLIPDTTSQSRNPSSDGTHALYSPRVCSLARNLSRVEEVPLQRL